MNKILAVLILAVYSYGDWLGSLTGGFGYNIFYNSASCVLVDVQLKRYLGKAERHFNKKRQEIDRDINALTNEVYKQISLFGQKHSNNTVALTVKTSGELAKKKEIALQKQNLKLEELHSDLLILENELLHIKNELLLVEIKNDTKK